MIAPSSDSSAQSLARHAELIFTKNLTADLRARFAQVRCVILDVDGVLTDGGMYYDAQGEALKRFNVLDGLGIKLLQSVGITIAIISARDTPIVRARASELGIEEVQQGSHQKGKSFDALLARLNLSAAQCAFIGDDIIDLPILQRAGLACAPATAHRMVIDQVHYLTQAPGGNGAIREICDTILAVQGHWSTVLKPYQP